MSRLWQKTAEEENEQADVDDNIPTNYIVVQISESSDASKMNEEAVEPLPNNIKMKDAQADDVLCQ